MRNLPVLYVRILDAFRPRRRFPQGDGVHVLPFNEGLSSAPFCSLIRAQRRNFRPPHQVILACVPFHTATTPRSRVPRGLRGGGLQQTLEVELPRRGEDQTASRSAKPVATAQRPTGAAEVQGMELQAGTPTDVAKPEQSTTALLPKMEEVWPRPPVITDVPEEFPSDIYSQSVLLSKGERSRYDVEKAKTLSAKPNAISLSMESRLVNLEIVQRKIPKFSRTLEIIRSTMSPGLTASETNSKDFRRTDTEIKKTPNIYAWLTVAFYVFASVGSYKFFKYKYKDEMRKREEERKWAEKLLEVEATGGAAAAELLMQERLRSMRDSYDGLYDPNDDAVIDADQRSAQTFEELAENYDKGIGLEETAMGTNFIRRWMLSRYAKGDVLEVGSGTGRNFKYYKPKLVKSLTLVDRSPAMLQVAKRKAMKQFGKNCLTTDAPTKLRVRTHQADAQNLADFEDQSFDTVVSTFTLCSFADPVQALQEMARVCKPDGRIVLLEHGRSGENNSSWAPRFITGLITGHIDSLLDRNAESHREKWGCTWNRDISGVVTRAGLEVETEDRWHFGTTYYIIAKPPLPYDFVYSEQTKKHPALVNA